MTRFKKYQNYRNSNNVEPNLFLKEKIWLKTNEFKNQIDTLIKNDELDSIVFNDNGFEHWYLDDASINPIYNQFWLNKSMMLQIQKIDNKQNQDDSNKNTELVSEIDYVAINQMIIKHKQLKLYQKNKRQKQFKILLILGMLLLVILIIVMFALLF